MLSEQSHRNVAVLSVCQAVSQSGYILVFATVGLAGKILAPVPELATLPLGIQYVAMMSATIPASLMMGRFGRRLGFIVGQVFGLIGALISAWALVSGSFWLFVAAAIGIGIHTAFFQYLRFAAADTASPEFRPKAISYVMAGGIVAGLLGPELAKRTADLLAPATFAGAYVTLAGICALNILVLQFVRIPKTVAVDNRHGGRPLAVIARQPAVIVAILSAVVGYGLMNLLMVASPLAMAGCGFSFADSAEVLRWHVLGMYVPSFFTGSLIRRFGVLRVIVAGAALLLSCVAISLLGSTFVNFLGALLALGVAWNFLYVGGTTLLAGAYRTEERAKMQGFNDFLVYSTTAMTSFASGAMTTALGWQEVNLLAILPVGLVLGAVIWLTCCESRPV
ncbi:MAG: MFS transporter [Telmatospirillum sp.]|nr:MFS transporter [Telmatospirillum sp.]